MAANPRFMRTRIAVALASLSGAVGLALIATTQALAPSPDERAIEQIITRAELANNSPPIIAAGAALAGPARRYLQSSAIRALGDLYDVPLVPVRLRLVQDELAAQRSGQERLVGGGIRDVRFDSVAFTGATATAQLSFTNWREYRARNTNGSVAQIMPSNRIIADFVLTKTSQGWRIWSETERFAPGSEP